MPRATTRAPGLCLKISLELSFPLRPLTLHPFFYAPACSRPSFSVLTPFASFNGGTRVIAVPLNFKKKTPVGTSLSHIALAFWSKEEGNEKGQTALLLFFFLIIKQLNLKKGGKVTRFLWPIQKYWESNFFFLLISMFE